MRLIPSTFACLLLLPVQGAADRLTTTAELRALTEDESREGRAFDLAAQIIHKTAGITGCAFAVRDRTGGLIVTEEDSPSSFSYRPGDIVRWQGLTKIDSDRQLIAFCTNSTLSTFRELPAPLVADPKRIPFGDYDFARIRIQGIIANAFRDEIDPNYIYLVLETGETTTFAAFRDLPEAPCPSFNGLVSAEVELTGTCMPSRGGRRIFLGPSLRLNDIRDVRILKTPPADPFDAPVLEDLHHIRARDVTNLGRRRVDGLVTARWQRRNFLLETKSGNAIRVELAEGDLPATGSMVTVVGAPETDLYHLNLSRATWKQANIRAWIQPRPEPVTARDLLFDEQGQRKFKPRQQGKLFRLTGTIRSMPPIDDPSARLLLNSDGNLIPVDISNGLEVLGHLQVECRVSVTGVCVLDIQNWSPNTVFPRIEGLSLVIRSPSDITVLARPPWWTPARLLVVIGSLLAVLIGILVWNRILNRLVERRSRELLREQAARVGDKLKVGERTRLAVELHDSLSQTLTGVSFQIDAAEQARQKDPSQIKRYLDVARQTLKSCREELRNCLWDLRNNALEEANAEVAIRRTVEPQIGDAELMVNFSVPRQKLTDNTFHAILRIVRELAVNGVRHGGAARIAIAGRIDGGRLVISVTDDGCGFDPENHPGVDEGHFGLLGVRERIEDLDGTLTIDSAPGSGSRITIELAL